MTRARLLPARLPVLRKSDVAQPIGEAPAWPHARPGSMSTAIADVPADSELARARLRPTAEYHRRGGGPCGWGSVTRLLPAPAPFRARREDSIVGLDSNREAGKRYTRPEGHRAIQANTAAEHPRAGSRGRRRCVERDLARLVALPDRSDGVLRGQRRIPRICGEALHNAEVGILRDVTESPI